MLRLDELVDETRLLWNLLVQIGERLHAGEEVTLGMRAILEHLGREGPSTVPGIARSRGVSRQHVQVLVNAVVGRGLVAERANPAHQRSPLLHLTPAGTRTLERMKRREEKAVAESALDVPEAELARAARTLRRVREGLGGRR